MLELTEDQRKNSAASLRAIADQLDPPAPTPAPAPAPPAQPVVTYPGFTQIFEEQFTTDCAEGEFLSKYGARWAAYPYGWRDTSRKGIYNPSIISVTGGILAMRLRTSSQGNPWVAAPEPKINGTNDLNQLYGRYEVRMRADAVDGYKTAWLLWPKSETWPRDGEIDFLEGDLMGTIGAFMHRQGGTSGRDQDGYSCAARYPEWHTVALEWTPSRCEFFVDGRSIGRSTARIPNTPMRCVLQTETELNSTYPAKTAVANVQLDYVKVWRYTG